MNDSSILPGEVRWGRGCALWLWLHPPPVISALLLSSRLFCRAVLSLQGQHQAISPNQGLFDSGLDSVSAEEFARRLQERLLDEGWLSGKHAMEEVISSTAVFDCPTPRLIAEHVEDVLNRAEERESKSADASEPTAALLGWAVGKDTTSTWAYPPARPQNTCWLKKLWRSRWRAMTILHAPDPLFRSRDSVAVADFRKLDYIAVVLFPDGP